MPGAVRNGIDHTLPGVVGRGVLLDIARLRGVEWIRSDDDPITSADLDAAAERQAVEVRTGDALLVRTGWRRKALMEGWSVEWLRPCPGLGLDAVRWLHDRQMAAVAADNPGVEHLPSGLPDARLPLHCVRIRDMGLQIGEMFDLGALAEDCAADGQWDFFFSAPPLRVTGAVGSTASPIAVTRSPLSEPETNSSSSPRLAPTAEHQPESIMSAAPVHAETHHQGPRRLLGEDFTALASASAAPWA